MITIAIKVYNFMLTNVKMFSDWVIKPTLDQSKCFISNDIPWAISISLDTVLRNLGNSLVSERWGDELDWDIFRIDYKMHNYSWQILTIMCTYLHKIPMMRYCSNGFCRDRTIWSNQHDFRIWIIQYLINEAC